ncbi:ABC transporter permease subunit [Paratissierella segnis]|jgi:simple sugar transport system permease protein|uniref:ABC transporter permease n=1 Tax=Paratissierella segnis TaxID=2763679 RepID=A0A926ES45_9FIRM|nr:ABC transporter permease [Paratissierella segnis]MBC8587861.1 ABC transporter permease [Paratissierella segnis]
MAEVKGFVKNIGWPRIIIAIFLLSLFIVAPIFGVRVDTSIHDVIVRFGMNAIMVLSMIPMIQSGCGLNFGIPVGLVAGMLGAVISIEFNLTGLSGILVAMVIGVAFAALFGFLYGLLLNRVKGDEMIIATYVGFSFVFFMNMMWLVLPFKNPASVQGFKGEGLRVTISVEDYWFNIFNNFLKIDITKYLSIPVGMILVFAIMALFVWAFFKTKTGTAITAVGSNPDYARASGISIDKMRTISVMLSTMIAAVGMIVYEQSFGFIQMYNAPSAFAFPSVAAILLGGASVNKASITNVIIGTILFQGILTMTPSVINSAINIDVSEIIRIVVSNGMIVYALTRKGK